MLENFRSLEHFHHKRAPVSEQVVFSADPREQSIYDPNRGSIRGDERTGLREHRDQRGLP